MNIDKDEKQYHLSLNNFDGPLDLLLSLVKDKQMDILNINLVELADEYIKIINLLKDKNIDLASEYLVMASTLLQIKARVILSHDGEDKVVEKEKENLLEKLVERQQFKNVSKTLRMREIERKKIFFKDQSELDKYAYEIEKNHLDGSLDAIKIIIALRKMFERTNANQMRQATIKKFKFSPAERRREIINLLKKSVVITFEEIFTVPTINHFVVTGVTILDMARKQELVIKQKKQFGEILFERGAIDGI